jgi:hypothetical protein
MMGFDQSLQQQEGMNLDAKDLAVGVSEKVFQMGVASFRPA